MPPRPRPDDPGFWDARRRAVAELHLRNVGFFEDLRDFLKTYGEPSEVRRLSRAHHGGKVLTAFVGFRLRWSKPGRGRAWDTFIYEVQRLSARWPHLPPRFWHGRLSTARKALAVADVQAHQPEAYVDPALPSAVAGRASLARRRAELGRSIFERGALAVVPVYPWSSAKHLAEVVIPKVVREVRRLLEAGTVRPRERVAPLAFLSKAHGEQLRRELAVTRAREAGLSWDAAILRAGEETGVAETSEPCDPWRLAVERLGQAGRADVEGVVEQIKGKVKVYPGEVRRKADRLGPRP